MQHASIEVDIESTPLVSVDGIAEFTISTGAFHREYGQDADPLLEWGIRSRAWISALRKQFGKRLRHIAVASKYKHKQFHDPAWGDKGVHPLDALCVDDTYRGLTIDDSQLAEVIPKTENDATTSPEFMAAIKDVQKMVFIGVTFTTCGRLTLRSLFTQMASGAIPLRQIIMPKDGFASRASRGPAHESIWTQIENDPRIIVVPRLEDIRWTGHSGMKA